MVLPCSEPNVALPFKEDHGCWYGFFGTGISTTRQDAERLCAKQNARLPIITSQHEAVGLRNQLGKPDFSLWEAFINISGFFHYFRKAS